MQAEVISQEHEALVLQRNVLKKALKRFADNFTSVYSSHEVQWGVIVLELNFLFPRNLIWLLFYLCTFCISCPDFLSLSQESRSGKGNGCVGLYFQMDLNHHNRQHLLHKTSFGIECLNRIWFIQ